MYAGAHCAESIELAVQVMAVSDDFLYDLYMDVRSNIALAS